MDRAIILASRNLPESLSGIEINIAIAAKFMGHDARNLPESLSGIEIFSGKNPKNPLSRPEIYPNPFQGLKQLPPTPAGNHDITRNLPESLSGIETSIIYLVMGDKSPEIYPNPFQGLKHG